MHSDPSSSSSVLAGPLLPVNMTVWTPEIEQLCLDVAGSIRTQGRGCAVAGQQCNGKSAATRYLIQLLPETIGYPLGVVRWTISGERTSQTERNFIQECLIQSGCGAVAHRDISVLRQRLYRHLADHAQATVSRQLIIIVDEAQNLQRKEYSHLIHCANSLEDLGVKPFFVLMGQPELGEMPKTWLEIDGMQVMGRFFSAQYRFRGIAPEDFRVVLDCFDVPAADGEERVSARLMPQIAGTNWTLGEWATAYGEAIAVLMNQQHITSQLRLPMQYFKCSLLTLLDRVVQARLDPRQVDVSAVLSALKEVGFMKCFSYYVEDEEPTPRSASVVSNRCQRLAT